MLIWIPDVHKGNIHKGNNASHELEPRASDSPCGYGKDHFFFFLRKPKGETAQQLKVLAKDLNSGPSSYLRWLTTTYNSCFMGADASGLCG